MLNTNEIKELITLINGSSIQEFTLKQGATEMTLKKANTETISTNSPAVSMQPAPMLTEPTFNTTLPAAPIPTLPEVTESVEPKKVDSNTVEVVSPMVGTFYSSSNPDADAFVKSGDRVNQDTVVCIIEAMKLFNEIEAEVDGEIVEVLAENGQLVEYGQPLFRVRPTGGQ